MRYHSIPAVFCITRENDVVARVFGKYRDVAFGPYLQLEGTIYLLVRSTNFVRVPDRYWKKIIRKMGGHAQLFLFNFLNSFSITAIKIGKKGRRDSRRREKKVEEIRNLFSLQTSEGAQNYFPKQRSTHPTQPGLPRDKSFTARVKSPPTSPRPIFDKKENHQSFNSLPTLRKINVSIFFPNPAAQPTPRLVHQKHPYSH
jgi:hypothetical protein